MTFYRWRQEFGGLKIEQVKRLKDVELENSGLRRAVSDLTLDKLILIEAAKEGGRAAKPTRARRPMRRGRGADESSASEKLIFPIRNLDETAVVATVELKILA